MQLNPHHGSSAVRLRPKVWVGWLGKGMSPPSPPVTVDRLGFFFPKTYQAFFKWKPCGFHAYWTESWEFWIVTCFFNKKIYLKNIACASLFWIDVDVPWELLAKKNGFYQSYGWFTVHFGESSFFFLRDVVFMLVACCSYKWSYETLLKLGFWAHLAGTKQKLSTNVSCLAFDDHRASHPTLRPCLTFTKILWNS